MENYKVSNVKDSICIDFDGNRPCNDCPYCCNCINKYTIKDIKYNDYSLIRNIFKDECDNCYKIYLLGLKKEVNEIIKNIF